MPNTKERGHRPPPLSFPRHLQDPTLLVAGKQPATVYENGAKNRPLIQTPLSDRLSDRSVDLHSPLDNRPRSMRSVRTTPSLQNPFDTPATSPAASIDRLDYFRPRTPTEKIKVPELRLPERVAKKSDDEILREDANRQSVQLDGLHPTSSGPLSPFPAEKATTPLPLPETARDVKEAEEADLIARGKKKMTRQKYYTTAFLVSVNFMFIFCTWYFPRYYYLYLPFIMLPLALNICMIVSIIFFKILYTFSPEEKIQPDHPEDLVLVMPCYNETLEECTGSLNSLIDQIGIDDNKKAIMVVCDGKVRGPGMEKTTAGYLVEDILTEHTHQETIKNAYRAWDGQSMDVEVTTGMFRGTPFYCCVKKQNQGKRDSLIVIRSFLYKYNNRRKKQEMIFSPHFFESMTNWLENDVKMDNVDHLIGMDADTIFDKHCIRELLKESLYPNTVGVCGYVTVDYRTGNWDPWSIYQNAEYTIAQGLRRLHQSIGTKKVSCLPGCCQLLKICDYTCCDDILIHKFGYHPTPLDSLLKQTRATASEDRNHCCQVLVDYPMARTRQALRAKAYTDVPHSLSVFLSQRRRWTLGATSNDMLLVTARYCQWWERIVAASNVIVWCLNVFVIASLACMIVAFMNQPWEICLAFAAVMMVPILYYLIMVFWLPDNMVQRFQFLAGLCIFVTVGPFLNISVMVFAVRNMDSFGWGKTRKVIAEDDVPETPAAGKEVDPMDEKTGMMITPTLSNKTSRSIQSIRSITKPSPTKAKLDKSSVLYDEEYCIGIEPSTSKQ